MIVAEKKEQPAKELETPRGMVRLELRNSEAGRWYYVILKPSGSSEEKLVGDVSISSEKKVAELKSHMIVKRGGLSESRLYASFKKEGLSDNDEVVKIEQFFPLSVPMKEKAIAEKKRLLYEADQSVHRSEADRFIHRRIGSASLILLLEDLKSQGVAGVYCESLEKEFPEMRELLKKEPFAFKEVEKSFGMVTYIKKLAE